MAVSVDSPHVCYNAHDITSLALGILHAAGITTPQRPIQILHSVPCYDTADIYI
jgi:hypothetical protein